MNIIANKDLDLISCITCKLLQWTGHAQKLPLGYVRKQDRQYTCDVTVKHVLATIVATEKISPITGPRCPEGSRNLRFPDYVTMAQLLQWKGNEYYIF